jgi:hypothetical protein
VSGVVPGSGPRKRLSPRKSAIASDITRCAGSSASTMGLRDSNGTSLAHGMPAAISWANEYGARKPRRDHAGRREYLALWRPSHIPFSAITACLIRINVPICAVLLRL